MELILRDLSVGYRYSEPLCRGINARIESGQCVALVGNNGTGKSTLLRTIASIIPSLGGEVLLDLDRVDTMRPIERACSLAFVSTEVISTAYTSVRQLVELGRTPFSGWAGRLSSLDREAVDQAMVLTNTMVFARCLIDKLSDGQRQRVMIARALAQTTPLLILDEPTAFLDPENREMIILLLDNLARSTSKIVLYSTHEVELARCHTTARWVMRDGLLRVD